MATEEGGLKQARCVSNKEMSAWAVHMGPKLILGNPASNKPAKDKAIQPIVGSYLQQGAEAHSIH